MKNCKIVQTGPSFRIPMYGMPPLQGWALRLVSGIEDEEIKPGHWMSKWYVGPNTVDFMFEAGLHMVFNEKADAARIRDHLREVAEIVTEVVKVGNPVL